MDTTCLLCKHVFVEKRGLIEHYRKKQSWNEK